MESSERWASATASCTSGSLMYWRRSWRPSWMVWRAACPTACANGDCRTMSFFSRVATSWMSSQARATFPIPR
ncbi:hypothetical protein ACFQH6_10905 [Halobacteriaceae archaeon GCM10025711]